MSEPETLGNACLALEAVGRIAAGARVMLDAPAPDRLARSHRQLESLARAGRVIYGLNTGCGPLCDRPVSPADAARFQLNLVRSHASGLGPAHPPEVVRATMAVRAHTLAQGRSAVRPIVVETLAGMLNAGILPIVPETGSVGASGDLVELPTWRGLAGRRRRLERPARRRRGRIRGADSHRFASRDAKRWRS